MRKMTKISIAAISVLFLVSALLLPNIAFSAPKGSAAAEEEQSVFMTVEGKNLGNISHGAGTAESVGARYIEGHEDEIYCFAFSHLLRVPLDPQSGLPAGRHIHAPVVVTKYFDRSSPFLYQALVTGEKLQVVLKFYRATPTGGEEHFFTIELLEAPLVAIASASTETQGKTKTEEIAFTYATIKWTNVVSGQQYRDNWSIPK